MRANLIVVIIGLLLPFALLAQHPLLRSGPMPGYSEMREAMIWVQTIGIATVQVEYAPVGQKGRMRLTNLVTTTPSEAYTAKLIADSVEAGQRYSYQLIINGERVSLPYPTEFQTQAIWRWRSDPPDFTLVAGSGAYINETKFDRPGKPYGGDYHIYQSILLHKPDLMIWLGDNVYLREPDWNSMTGILGRYTHDRAIPELQPLLASTHHYAIWDDHDYGPNDSDKGFWNKENTLTAFELFWGNPSVGVHDIDGAISSFQWADVDFFMLDNRWYRDPNMLKKENKTQLGEKQLEWLFDNLVSSLATFKIVVLGGQFLSTAGVYETYTNNGFAGERQKIIDFIYEQDIKNVIFLTGDVHFTELSVLREEGKPTIWDLTFSPFNSGANTSGGSWNNTLRVPGTVVGERNFGKVIFRGPAKNRQMVVSSHTADNQLKWEIVIDRE
ncbi:MAG: alkaline phosphatase D family protein [Bacteroidales bacterium]|nr:alkaline phosphatase D family protein [Bacteroidales bacterium]